MQGYYGAASAKPTTLMFTHPPDGLERLFQNSRTQETLPLKASIGRQSDGSFATAGLKTYPRGLCSAIALAWGQSFLKRTPTDVDMQPPAVYEKVFESLHSRIGSEVMEGADFCIDAQYQPVWVELNGMGGSTTTEFFACRLRIDFSREKKNVDIHIVHVWETALKNEWNIG